jgi:serine/threonine protein phosphatase 1
MTKKKSYLIAIGDIHGCNEALEVLLKKLTRLPYPCVFLGDYLDRGPSSVKVIEQLIQAKAQHPNWKFLMGNHEEMFLTDLDRSTDGFDTDSAGEQYAAIGGVPVEHRQFLEDLLPWWQSDKYLFVHGGIKKDVHLPVEQHDLDELLWTYDVSPDWRGKTIVRGHQVVRNPRQHHNQIDLDTGCCFGRRLTAGILDDESGLMVGYLQATYDGEVLNFSNLVLERSKPNNKRRAR